MSKISEIADYYQHHIEIGELKPEDMPTRAQIETEWEVSHTTANRVHQQLIKAGVIPCVPRSALPIPQLDEKAQARFWGRVRTPDENGCLLWNKPSTGGYGRFQIRGKQYMAHRVAWSLLVGHVPEGMELDHVWERGCASNACVNVQHLEPVTRAENNRRKGVAIRTEAALRAMDTD